MPHRYFVYILCNHSRTLYIGVTSDILRRTYEHKQGLVEGFSERYRLKKLVYLEETSEVLDAIRREKELKGWMRHKKIALIERANPGWDDLSAGWH